MTPKSYCEKYDYLRSFRKGISKINKRREAISAQEGKGNRHLKEKRVWKPNYGINCPYKRRNSTYRAKLPKKKINENETTNNKNRLRYNSKKMSH